MNVNPGDHVYDDNRVVHRVDEPWKDPEGYGDGLSVQCQPGNFLRSYLERFLTTEPLSCLLCIADVGQ